MHLEGQDLVLPTVGEQCALVTAILDCSDRANVDEAADGLQKAAHHFEQNFGLTAADYEAGFNNTTERVRKVLGSKAVVLVEAMRNAAKHSTNVTLKTALAKIITDYEESVLQGLTLG